VPFTQWATLQIGLSGRSQTGAWMPCRRAIACKVFRTLLTENSPEKILGKGTSGYTPYTPGGSKALGYTVNRLLSVSPLELHVPRNGTLFSERNQVLLGLWRAAGRLREALLVSQRDHGINTHRAPRGDVTRRQRYHREQNRHARECGRVGRLHFE
jgi:hypothetical protein